MYAHVDKHKGRQVFRNSYRWTDKSTSGRPDTVSVNRGETVWAWQCIMRISQRKSPSRDWGCFIHMLTCVCVFWISLRSNGAKSGINSPVHKRRRQMGRGVERESNVRLQIIIPYFNESVYLFHLLINWWVQSITYQKIIKNHH